MIKYIGDGTATFPGVPMRDLSDEEWAALAPAVQRALVDAKLFDTVAPVVVEAPAPSKKVVNNP